MRAADGFELNKFWNDLCMEMMNVYTENSSMYNPGNTLLNFHAILRIKRPSMTKSQRDALEQLLWQHFGAETLNNQGNVLEVRFGWIDEDIAGKLAKRKMICDRFPKMAEYAGTETVFIRFADDMVSRKGKGRYRIERPSEDGYIQNLMSAVSEFKTRNSMHKDSHIITYAFDSFIPYSYGDKECGKAISMLFSEYGICSHISDGMLRMNMKI